MIIHVIQSFTCYKKKTELLLDIKKNYCWYKKEKKELPKKILVYANPSAFNIGMARELYFYFTSVNIKSNIILSK